TDRLRPIHRSIHETAAGPASRRPYCAGSPRCTGGCSRRGRPPRAHTRRAPATAGFSAGSWLPYRGARRDGASATARATPRYVRGHPPATSAIKVDQVGYIAGAVKIAFVVTKSPASAFTLHRVRDGRVVFSGAADAPVDDRDSGDRVQALDFSAVRDTGSFYIDIPGVGTSWPFAIDRDPYARTFYLAMRGFYGQRCGIAVDLGPAFHGFTHAACHVRGAYHVSSGKPGWAPATRGWPDAGA